jgi:hypothetical protein
MGPAHGDGILDRVSAEWAGQGEHAMTRGNIGIPPVSRAGTIVTQRF